MCQNDDNGITPRLPKPLSALGWAGLAGLHLVGCSAPFHGTQSEPILAATETTDVMWISNLQGGEVVAFDSVSGQRLGHVVDPLTLPESLLPFRPSSTALDGHRIIVSQYSTGEVLVFDGETGAFDAVLFENQPVSDAPRVEEPCMVRQIDGQTWVLGNDTRNLLILDRHGGVVDEVGKSPLYLRDPHGFDVTPDGLLYVALSPTHPGRGLIQIWDLNVGRPVGEFAPYGALQEGTGLMVDRHKNIVVSDWFGNQVVTFDAHTGEHVGVWVDEADGLDQPVATAEASDGALLVLDRGGVLRVQDGAVQRIVSGHEEGFDWARGISVPSAN